MPTNNDRREFDQSSDPANDRNTQNDQRNMQGNREEGLNSPSKTENQTDYSSTQRDRGQESGSDDRRQMQNDREGEMGSPSRREDDSDYSAGSRRDSDPGSYTDTDNPEMNR